MDKIQFKDTNPPRFYDVYFKEGKIARIHHYIGSPERTMFDKYGKVMKDSFLSYEHLDHIKEEDIKKMIRFILQDKTFTDFETLLNYMSNEKKALAIVKEQMQLEITRLALRTMNISKALQTKN